MSRMIKRIALKTSMSIQAAAMQKRERVLAVGPTAKGLYLFVDGVEDNDTRAFDRAHERYFMVVPDAGPLPDMAQHVGSCTAGPASAPTTYHVFEVKGR